MEEKFPKWITDEITSDLPRNWKWRSLSELCKIKIGGTPKTNVKSFWNGSIKWATAKDISNTSSRFIQKTEKTITKEGSDRSAAKILPASTIVITARGTVGKMAIIPEPMAINQTCYGLIAENIDNLFLYYSVKSAIEKLMGVSYGTVFDTITIKSFDDIKLLVPNNRSEQLAIAKILSDFDSKIELNQKMDETLEAIAQAIFKRWFIDFNFPNEDGRPYKSSGGEMVDSEMGEIPKGWQAYTIGKELTTVLGGTPSTKNKDYWSNEGIPWINSGKINEFRIIFPSAYITAEALKHSATKLMPKGTTVLAITGATLGKVSRIEREMCANQSVVGVLGSEKLPSEYIYFWIKNNINRLISNKTGGAQQHINKGNVDEIEILVPDSHIMEHYVKTIRPIFDKISASSFEEHNLSKIRDIILPKLMTGKIRVPQEE